MSEQRSEDRDTRIARRAYEKWEAEGRPAGRHDAHWHDAAAEVDAVQPAPPADKSKAERTPKKAAAPTGEAKPARARKPKSTAG